MRMGGRGWSLSSPRAPSAHTADPPVAPHTPTALKCVGGTRVVLPARSGT